MTWGADPKAGERVERAWRMARAQEARLRDEGDDEAADRVIRMCMDHHGAEPGSSATRRQVEGIQERAVERERQARRARRGEPTAEEINEERRRNGFAPMSATSIEQARRLTGAYRSEIN